MASKKSILFFDTEVHPKSEKILDLGAVDANDNFIHGDSVKKFQDFIQPFDFICGHNIFQHDLKHLAKHIQFNQWEGKIIDRLYLNN